MTSGHGDVTFNRQMEERWSLIFTAPTSVTPLTVGHGDITHAPQLIFMVRPLTLGHGDETVNRLMDER